MASYDTLWVNAQLATMESGRDGFAVIADGAIAAKDGTIAWIGNRADLPGPPETLATTVIDAHGCLITPGLIDPHTHLIFGGDRIADFERRIGGEGYAAAAHGGSGIAHTVACTRAANAAELERSASARLRDMIAGGATTIEIKSGYGLDVDTELRMLRVGRRLAHTHGVSIVLTYLGAHTIPPEYATRRDAYLDLICDELLPRIAREGLADAVDVFCESIAFTPRESARVLDAAAALGLRTKLHADQLADGGGAALAAAHHALSADHLEFTSEAGVAALAAAGTVATILPGAFFALRETQRPPIGLLRRYEVPIALATDCNPGTSPVASLTTIMNFACVLFGLTPVEALAGVTRNAARALGLTDRGELRTGLRCDLALWNASSPAELSYWLGRQLCAGTVYGGAVH